MSVSFDPGFGALLQWAGLLAALAVSVAVAAAASRRDPPPPPSDGADGP